MANISAELAAILAAVYGEDVRGSIHDAIKKINDVSEVVISAGTAVTSASSSSTGFFEDSLYINTNTCDLWKCVGTDTWSKLGNLKGIGITSIAKTGTSVLTDTYTITYTDGTTDTFTVTNGKGITSIAKTATSGLVDTYTITYNDGTTTTFDVTNGQDGTTWYDGTAISGKHVNPTVYSGSGIAMAQENDFYMNMTEHSIYRCTLGGDPTTATWVWEFDMSGTSYGAGTGIDITGNTISLDAGLNDLNDLDINGSTLADGDVPQYNAGTGKWENKPIGIDKSFVRYAGAINYADLITYASTYLKEEYEDSFFLLKTSGTIGSGEASQYWTSNFSDGDMIPEDSHIAVININRGTVNPPVYKYDDFGGFVDISGKLDSSLFDALNSRTPKDITSRIQADNGASLLAAISEQNLAKYGYSIGDYFMSPTNRTLTEETYSSGTVTQTDKTVKLKYTLADMDTYYGAENSYAVVNTHHIGIVVDSGVNRQWNAAALTSGGYESSKLHTFLKATTHASKNYGLMYAIQQDIGTLFGTWTSHLIPNNKLFATYSGTAFSWAWADTAPAQNQYITALSEIEVYGSAVWAAGDVITDKYQMGEAVKQLEVFRKYRFNQIFGAGASVWLRSMNSASGACCAGSGGFAADYSVYHAGRAAGLILLH